MTNDWFQDLTNLSIQESLDAEEEMDEFNNMLRGNSNGY